MTLLRQNLAVSLPIGVACNADVVDTSEEFLSRLVDTIEAP